MEEKELMSVKGNNGRLIIFENSVYFERKSVIGNVDAIASNSNTGYYNEKNITFDMINGIEWNKASIWRNGYISLAVEGELKNTNGLAGATKNATSLVFFPKANDDAAKCVEYISKKIKELKDKPKKVEISNSPQLSQADELIKFKKLLDEGIISEDEFAKAKERIINKL